MNASDALRLALAVAGVAALATASVWAQFRRRQKTPEEIERLRRLEVNRRGRIISGRIVDLPQTEPGDLTTRLAVYQYEVAGVKYEAAQDLSHLPAIASLTWGAAGQSISVKYDPKNPTDSIVACEDWCGFPALDPGAKFQTEPAQSTTESVKKS